MPKSINYQLVRLLFDVDTNKINTLPNGGNTIFVYKNNQLFFPVTTPKIGALPYWTRVGNIFIFEFYKLALATGSNKKLSL